MLDNKAQQRERTEAIRGWIIYLLYKNHPKPVEFRSLQRLLDRLNYPLSRRRLAGEVSYLQGLRLLRLFPSGATTELDEVAQAKWVQRYADSDSDEELGVALLARITTAGINFQDGLDEHAGISRAE